MCLVLYVHLRVSWFAYDMQLFCRNRHVCAAFKRPPSKSDAVFAERSAEIKNTIVNGEDPEIYVHCITCFSSHMKLGIYLFFSLHPLHFFLSHVTCLYFGVSLFFNFLENPTRNALNVRWRLRPSSAIARTRRYIRNMTPFLLRVALYDTRYACFFQDMLVFTAHAFCCRRWHACISFFHAPCEPDAQKANRSEDVNAMPYSATAQCKNTKVYTGVVLFCRTRHVRPSSATARTRGYGRYVPFFVTRIYQVRLIGDRKEPEVRTKYCAFFVPHDL